MNHATRTVKQEITETAKFLTSLKDEHARTVNSINQGHVDEYVTSGPSTRKHIRNFVRYLTCEGTITGLGSPAGMPKLPLSLRKSSLSNRNVTVRTRAINFDSPIWALVPSLRNSRRETQPPPQRRDRPHPNEATIQFGESPPPLPDLILPLIHQHLFGAKHRTPPTPTPHGCSQANDQVIHARLRQFSTRYERSGSRSLE